MKPISELKLETIQLEDQVLLVKNGEIPENWYLDDANQIRESIIDDPDYWEGRLGYKSIIASTKPLKGLPLLVIKDGIKKLATKTLSEQDWDTSKGLPFNEGYLKGFKHGFKKARETFKFTEEDMIEFVAWLNNTDEIFEQTKHIDFTKSDKDIGKELLEIWKKQRTNKELWIEVEEVISHFDVGYNPKITNNQIKAIWK